MSHPESETKSYALTAEARSRVRVDATARDVQFTLDSPPIGGARTRDRSRSKRFSEGSLAV